MVRGGVPFHGRLTALLTEGLAANPLWLIKYENHKEEELYEAAFGKLIKSANGGRLSMKKLTEDKDKAEESLSNRPRNPNPPKVKKAKSESSTKSSSSGDDSNKKTVSFSRGTSPVVSEDSEQINEEQKKKQSDREQRSLRRQAIIDVPSKVRSVVNVHLREGVQSIRHKAIVINQHRNALTRLIISRLDQHAI